VQPNEILQGTPRNHPMHAPQLLFQQLVRVLTLEPPLDEDFVRLPRSCSRPVDFCFSFSTARFKART
jgi:hypothetical protein